MKKAEYVGHGNYLYRGMIYQISYDLYTPVAKQHRDTQASIDRQFIVYDNVKDGIPADECLRKFFDEVGDI